MRNNRTVKYIDTQNDFAAFIDTLKDADAVALDTEFLREKSYYPRLCLLQIASRDSSALIDPFGGLDLSALNELLSNDSIVKVFHAPMQDIEIILHETGVFPSPIFDTQTAALFLGHQSQVSYASLVQSKLGTTLKKADSLSDWSLRPLSQSQREYAIDDVTYLIELYYVMKQELKNLNRYHWFIEEQSRTYYPQRFEVIKDERFLHLKRVNQLSGFQLLLAREVCSWREEMAIKRDVPRKWVLSDEQIFDIAKKEVSTIDTLFRIRGTREKLSTPVARELVGILRNARKCPRKSWPKLPSSGKNEANVDIEIDIMNALIRNCARIHSLAASILAPHDDLVRLARGYYDDNLILTGWRNELIGQQLLDVLQGRIALSIGPEGLRIEHIQTER